MVVSQTAITLILSTATLSAPVALAAPSLLEAAAVGNKAEKSLGYQQVRTERNKGAADRGPRDKGAADLESRRNGAPGAPSVKVSPGVGAGTPGVGVAPGVAVPQRVVWDAPAGPTAARTLRWNGTAYKFEPRAAGYYYNATYGYWHAVHGWWHQAARCWGDPDGNPPGASGGPGTKWGNPPGIAGGPAASPDRFGRC